MFETICDLIPRDPHYPARARTLDILKRVLDGKLYDVLPYQFHEERAPVASIFRCATAVPVFATRSAGSWWRTASRCCSARVTSRPSIARIGRSRRTR